MDKKLQELLQRIGMLEAAVAGLLATNPEVLEQAKRLLGEMDAEFKAAGMPPPHGSLLHLLSPEPLDAKTLQ
jgi:hypothetical protein